MHCKMNVSLHQKSWQQTQFNSPAINIKHFYSYFVVIPLNQYNRIVWERSGSVVECLTRDRGAAGSSLTGVTALGP